MKILVYDDNPVYGGHQVMAAHGIEALASVPDVDVLCLVHADNRRFIERLGDIEACEVLQAPCVTHRLQGVRNRIDRRGIRKLKHLLRALGPDLLLCIQGDIEQSSQALIAARQAHIPCVSYIALPHEMTAMGARFGPLRDYCNKGLFQLPDRFITISRHMADRIRAQHAGQTVAVVPNGIERPAAQRSPGSHEAPFTLGLAGRIEFGQKRQDLLLEAFCSHSDLFRDCRLLFAGDGPDRRRLEERIARGPCTSRIATLGWQDDMSSFLASLDMLVIPSRYEGMPLVMLEALAYGIPVLGSRCDGMQEILPEAWTFEPGNPEALAEAFTRVRAGWKQAIDPLQERILREFTLESFRTGFVQAVMDRR